MKTAADDLFERAKKDTPVDVHYRRVPFCPSCEKTIEIPEGLSTSGEFRCSCGQLLRREQW